MFSWITAASSGNLEFESSFIAPNVPNKLHFIVSAVYKHSSMQHYKRKVLVNSFLLNWSNYNRERPRNNSKTFILSLMIKDNMNLCQYNGTASRIPIFLKAWLTSTISYCNKLLMTFGHDGSNSNIKYINSREFLVYVLSITSHLSW